MKAFPHTGSFGPGTDKKQGMDLRDWFAGQIMAQRMAGPKPQVQSAEEYYDVNAYISYRAADAMMKAREA